MRAPDPPILVSSGISAAATPKSAVGLIGPALAIEMRNDFEQPGTESVRELLTEARKPAKS